MRKLNLLLISFLLQISVLAQPQLDRKFALEPGILNYDKKNIITASKIEIESPKSGDTIFVFEDFWQGGGAFYSDGYVYTINGNYSAKRGDFIYILNENSNNMFRMTFAPLIYFDNKSLIVVKLKIEIKYFEISRDHKYIFTERTKLGINTNATIKIFYSDSILYKKRYSDIDSIISANLFTTFPTYKTMNTLFNKSLSKIIKNVENDVELKKIAY